MQMRSFRVGVRMRVDVDVILFDSPSIKTTGYPELGYFTGQRKVEAKGKEKQ